MDPLELAIKSALDSLCTKPEAPTWGYKVWTEEVIAAIGAVAQTAGYNWFPNRNAQSPGQGWLWDGVAQERNRAGALIAIPLVLESEWGGWAAIQSDFEKLLAARAAHRVMVCSATAKTGAQNNILRLRDIVRSRTFQSSQSGDRYLLSCWYGQPSTAGQFFTDLHIV